MNLIVWKCNLLNRKLAQPSEIIVRYKSPQTAMVKSLLPVAGITDFMSVKAEDLIKYKCDIIELHLNEYSLIYLIHAYIHINFTSLQEMSTKLKTLKLK